MYTIWDLLTLNSNSALNVSKKKPSIHILLKKYAGNMKFHLENCALPVYYAASSSTFLPLLAA